MDITFATNSGFLQGHFYPVRKSLQGEVLVFDASPGVSDQVPVNQLVPAPPALPVEKPNHGELVATSAPLTPAPEHVLATPAPLPVVPVQIPESPSLLTRVSRSASAVFAKTHDIKQARRVKSKVAGFRLANTVLSVVIFLSVIIGSVLLVPSVYYALFPADVVAVVAPEDGTAFGGAFDNQTVSEGTKTDETVAKKYIPPQDSTLPEGEWLIIPRIGVRSELQPTQKPEDALNTGLWLVPDFGRAGDTELPMIVAAHRFGWEWWWKSDYWKYHSFYNLPETQPGDRIEVISDQRKWIYEIYAGEEGEEITDYDADLILYTCKFLKSPIRHFRYARLIDPTKDTQD